jgi:hypothetical protein
VTPQALDLRRTPQAQAATSRAELPPRVLSCDFRSYERAGFLDEQDILDRERRRDAVLRHLGSLPGDTIMEPPCTTRSTARGRLLSAGQRRWRRGGSSRPRCSSPAHPRGR